MNKYERIEWRTGVFGHPELTPAQKLVLLKLETFADYPAGTNARPGVAALANQCRLKPRAVEGALQLGRELQLIEQTSRANPRRGHAAVYRLLSTRTEMRIEDEFNPHDDADGMEVLSARDEVQPARNGVSTRTSVQPTNPITPIQNTNPPCAQGVETQTTASVLLRNNLSTEPPRLTWKQLRKQVAELIDEGIDLDIIGEALRRWDQRTDIGPSVLPYLCSDVIREHAQVQAGVAEIQALYQIREAIDACDECDTYGRLDDLTDCPRHPNFRETT